MVSVDEASAVVEAHRDSSREGEARGATTGPRQTSQVGKKVNKSATDGNTSPSMPALSRARRAHR